MAGSDRWYFTKDVLQNTPSRKCGIDSDKELSYRQQAANLIQDMGQRLHVSQLCINTAIVYMHRFYTFHSFTKFHRNSISCCALFLAAKVEEQPRKLEHVIKVSHMCLHRETPALDIKSDTYQEQAMELVFNENLMLQTLGFDVAVEHPHSSVVNCCQLVRASKDLAQTSYFMATNSLHLTTMCLQYKPTVVACVCIHLACKWSSWEIPRSSEGKDWFYYVDKSVTLDLLEQLTSEFLAILDKCPSRLKRKILSGSGGGSGNSSSSSNSNSLAINKSIDEKKNSSNVNRDEVKPSLPSKSSTNQLVNEMTASVTCQPRRSPPSSPLMKKVKAEPQQSNKIPVAMSYAAYREKKDKERAHIQQDQKQQSEQLNKLNQVNKSSHPIAQQHRDKPIITDKLTAKQQQINIDKQKQSEERHRIKSKTQDNIPVFEGSNRSAYSSKTATSSAHLKSSQNSNSIISEDFYENLNLNKPSNHLNFNSIFSTDGEDSSDFKKEIATDLKMEFSDNDSNQSTDCLNLTSLPSAFMNDSSDSKTSLPNINLQTSIVETKPTSFTSIFSTPMTTSNLTSSSQSKPENVKTSIPSKYNDSLSVLSRIKPEPPPPMLSPLKHDSEMCSKHENQSLLSHSSKFETLTQQHLKSNNNPNSDLDSKQFQNSKVSKISPKSRSYTQHKNSSVLSQHSISGLREKEVSDVSQTIKLENSNNTLIETVINNNINNNINNIQNSNNTENIPLKQEFKDKNSKPAELPSVSSSKALTTNSIIEFDIKPSIESLAEQKPAFYLCPSPQQNINNVSAVPLDTSVTKTSVTHNKESKEKHSQEHDKHHDKHHKHHHRSRKSSKHKDKHKHKHKDKDREKHKRKDKDRDREKHNDVKDDPSFKISFSSPKDKPDLSTNLNIAPIKLKISKKKLSVDEPDKDNDVPQNPLKLRIQLNSKDQKLTANTTSSLTDSNNGSSSRKRRSSPKSSKKEKVFKHELETNIGKSYSSSKTKEEKISNKTSSKSKNATEKESKKSSNNSFNDEKRSSLSQQLLLQSKSNSQTNPFEQQMSNMANTQTTQQHNRSSKAHK